MIKKKFDVGTFENTKQFIDVDVLHILIAYIIYTQNNIGS